MFIVSAPSGAGKTSLVAALLERVAGLELSVSHTTRPARAGERHGQHYFFTDRAAFEAEIAAGNMLEHADVFGNLYGTSSAFVTERTRAGHDVVLEIDWQGANAARARLDDVVSIMILPPSLEALEARLRARAKDSDEVIRRRLALARKEMSQVRSFDHTIVNDDFETALAELQSVVVAARTGTPRRLRTDSGFLNDLLGTN